MKIFRTTALSLSILAIALAGCKTQQTEEETVREELVETSVLQQVDVERVLNYSTTLEGYKKMSVAPSLTGRIEQIFVEVGDKVQAGKMLVRMDQQQYNTTRLTFANLGIEMSRVEALQKTGAVSKQTYDQTKLSYDQTEESLKFLEANTFVRAQFPGVISAKNYENGELYSGQAILELTQINMLKALVNIPESYFPMVKAGMKIDVTSDIYPGEVFPATIEIVYPTVSPTSHTFTIKVKIPNGSERLRPGMYVNTTLAVGADKATVVPYQCVQRLTGSNERYVYINEGGVAKRVFVTLGDRFDDKIEIVADQITPGVEIVVTGAEKLVDGVKLKIAR